MIDYHKPLAIFKFSYGPNHSALLSIIKHTRKNILVITDTNSMQLKWGPPATKLDFE